MSLWKWKTAVNFTSMGLSPTLLCLGFVVFIASAFPHEGQDRLEGDQRVQSRLTEKGRKFLEKALNGADLEKYRSRLQKLGKNAQQQIGENKMQLQVNSHSENDTSIISINNKEGLLEYLYEGDILLTEEQLADLERQQSSGGGSRTKRQAVKNVQWTDAKVYYYNDNSISQEKANLIKQTLSYLQSITCVDFIYSASAPRRIKVANEGGCSSYVGMIGSSNNPEQGLSLADGCQLLGIVAHEFMHALGIHHEQSRYDRDKYISVDLSSVQRGMEFNFNKESEKNTINYTPYEYGSAMQYGAYAFVNEGGNPSMTPKDPEYSYTLGSYRVTFYDILRINAHYGCDKKCSGGNAARCQNGGVPNPRSCSTCNCPSGYSGALCNERPSGCGETLQATSEWQSKDIAFGSSNQAQKDFSLCNHWISAPEGKKIQIRLKSIDNWGCQHGCAWSGIELKVKKDQKSMNPLICCSKNEGIIYDSAVNPTPVITSNRLYTTKYTLEYRYADGGSKVTTTAPATSTGPVTSPGPVTTPGPVTNDCKNTGGDSYCESIASDFCKTTSSTIDLVKYYCAKTCKLCGVAKTPCKDLEQGCQDFKDAGYCTSLDKYLAEYHCAKTCGFCERPV